MGHAEIGHECAEAQPYSVNLIHLDNNDRHQITIKGPFQQREDIILKCGKNEAEEMLREVKEELRSMINWQDSDIFSKIIEYAKKYRNEKGFR